MQRINSRWFDSSFFCGLQSLLNRSLAPWLALMVLFFFSAQVFGQNLQYGTGTDVFWQQTNGNTVPSGTPPVDGLWYDTANPSTPADNWSSNYSTAGSGSSFLPGSTNNVVFDGLKALTAR